MEGISVGYEVSITNPRRGHGGRTADLFPHLDDRDGWLPTQEASREILDALEFKRAYDELTKYLQSCLSWRVIPRQYRERRKDGPQTAYLVRKAAEKIAPAFERFKQDWKVPRPPLSEEVLHGIVRAGLEVRRGGNPRH